MQRPFPESFKTLLRDLAEVAVRSILEEPMPRGGKLAKVGFVGFQKQGKSSLINGLLGSDVLPVDSLPATATVCEVVYGPVPDAAILSDGRWQRVPFDARAKYIDQNQLAGKPPPDRVRIAYPTDLLKTVSLIDTSGLGSSFHAHTSSTRSEFADLDLIVMVSSLHKPFGADDLEVARYARDNDVPIVCVLTKADESEYDDSPESVLLDSERFLIGVLDREKVKSIRNFLVSARENRNRDSRFFRAVDDLGGFLRETSFASVLHSRLSKARAGIFANHLRRQADLADAIKARDDEINSSSEARALLCSIEAESVLFVDILTARLKTLEAAIENINEAQDDAMLPELEEVFARVRQVANDPKGVREAWSLFRAECRDALRGVLDRYRLTIVRELETCSAELGIQAGNTAYAIRAFVSFDLPLLKDDLPRAALSEPGFMAITLGLHGQHVVTQFVEKLDEYIKEVDVELDATIEKAVNSIRSFALASNKSAVAPKKGAIKERITESESEQHKLSQKIFSIEADVTNLSHRLQLFEEAQVMVSQLFAAVTTDDSKLTVEFLNWFWRQGFDLKLCEIATAYVENRFDDATKLIRYRVIAMSVQEAYLARLYWICRCRSSKGETVAAVDQAMKTLDGVGAAFYELAPENEGYALAQRVVVALSQPNLDLEHEGPLETPSLDFNVLCNILAERTKAAAVTPAQLEALGGASDAIRLRDAYHWRVKSEPSSRPSFQDFANFFHYLSSADAEADLLARLRYHAKGIAPDPRDIPSLRKVLKAERWIALC
jgi:GTP-binding protein EngB required for normal cell division